MQISTSWTIVLTLALAFFGWAASTLIKSWIRRQAREWRQWQGELRQHLQRDGLNFQPLPRPWYVRFDDRAGRKARA